MDTFDLSEFLGVFIDEVDEQLDIIDQEILVLEQEGESPEVIQRIFRAAHTLKGSSATMGFEDMTKLTHEMEHLLDHVRNGRLTVTHDLTNLLFKCLDELKQLKDEIVSGQEERTDITPLIEEVQSFSSGKLSGQKEETAPRNKLSAEFQSKADSFIQQGLNIFQLDINISDECEMKSVRAFLIQNQLESGGTEIIQSVPDFDHQENQEEDYAKLQFLIATQQNKTEILDIVESMTDVDQVAVNVFGQETAAGEIASATAVEKTAIAAKSTEEEKKPQEKEVQPAGKPGPSKAAEKKPAQGRQQAQTIRVDVGRLEHLMNLVGELVIDQTRISQVSGLLHNRYTEDDTVDDLIQVSDHVARVIGELQESVMKVRMLPIRQLFSRFPRMVRDLAQTLDKDIDLVIEGQETELDRTVIEKIGDPLIHLIRNAVDHGLESKEDRIKANKPPKGVLRITASHEENQVVITVEDDGAGIDPEKMRASAVKKGVISAEEAEKLTDDEAAYLIFRPGFSTAKEVSDVSGRGVGMDIVRSHIESLNGIIELDTKLGKGTTFKIKLPLTLAIITGLIIRLADRTFILPMSNVVEIVRIHPDTIQTIKGKSIVVVREQVLPVVWLHDLLEIPRTDPGNRQLPVVIVGVGEKRIALIVDELQGNQEIVVKSLGKYVGKINGVSGATILGDGRVELILEVAGINRMINNV
ncbi:MAG TPA: chemotaxis protein CheA [Bacillus bacterium]|uniref:Chemotaxis protein CheA n=1 Tax=Siminovitchia fordii TaxID=254759 RepID=A0ABQ4K080_9BACI|nr:chemotaxis protein CheA [Siminovitchia fordii]GIN19174.1 chemotaxis protein CheA [Siminovitchia fordii]HBZ10220.1 chemotaxis protein CheA [Bacillus sp. (in: firmicutes)]